MSLTIQQMHDASLVAIRFDWSSRTCVFEFSGAPQLLEPFSLTFTDVTELSVPATYPWGPSVSVLEVADRGAGRYDFVMQSGDTITVVGPNNSFKPKPLRGSA
jgi:hypothetical protein